MPSLLVSFGRTLAVCTDSTQTTPNHCYLIIDWEYTYVSLIPGFVFRQYWLGKSYGSMVWQRSVIFRHCGVGFGLAKVAKRSYMNYRYSCIMCGQWLCLSNFSTHKHCSPSATMGVWAPCCHHSPTCWNTKWEELSSSVWWDNKLSPSEAQKSTELCHTPHRLGALQGGEFSQDIHWYI